MAETDSQPIVENEQVKELLALLKDNNTPGYEEFARLIGHVTEMEQRLSEATEELKAMRREVQGLQNHTLKDSLKKSCTDLFLTQARREYAQAQEKKTSVRDSLNRNGRQKAHSDKTKPHRQPER